MKLLFAALLKPRPSQLFSCEILEIFQSSMERLRTAAFFIILINVFIDKKPREIPKFNKHNCRFPRVQTPERTTTLRTCISLLSLCNSCELHVFDEN